MNTSYLLELSALAGKVTDLRWRIFTSNLDFRDDVCRAYAVRKKDGMTVGKIADYLGVSVSSVTSIVRDARWVNLRHVNKSCVEYLEYAVEQRRRLELYRNEYKKALLEFIQRANQLNVPLYIAADMVSLHYTRLYQISRQILNLKEEKMNNNLIIVSRHAGAIEWLRRRGIEGEVISHVADPEVIRGKTVVGNLPMHLAAAADRVGVIEMPNLPPDARGRDLSADEMEAFGASISWYRVEREEA